MYKKGLSRHVRHSIEAHPLLPRRTFDIVKDLRYAIKGWATKKHISQLEMAHGKPIEIDTYLLAHVW